VYQEPSLAVDGNFFSIFREVVPYDYCSSKRYGSGFDYRTGVK
jgi:hypothetical protein